jgi:hypothetical protein
MRRILATTILLGAPAAAWAFCGTYVGGAGAEIYSQVSEVVYVHIDGRTTLTLHSDATGDTDDFSMLIPVPQVIPEKDLHTVDAALIDKLDQYSAPRRVRYECEDFRPAEEADTDSDTDADSDSDYDTGLDVNVEAEYIIGEYSVSILSSGDAGDLTAWLNSHGYVMPEDRDDILQGYIDDESYFLAARLNDDDVLPADGRLSPLQLSYDSAAMSLPIRIGTLSAQGTQDLIVYGMLPYSSGTMGISNYTERQIEESCMWLPPEGDALNDEQFAAFYLNQLDEAYAEHGALWVKEYAWSGGNCDPCEGTPPDASDLYTFGFPEEVLEETYDLNLSFTRLHMRYAPDEATQDVMLYASGYTDNTQQRYIDYVHELESRFPICGQGYPLDPGVCDFDTEGSDDTGDGIAEEKRGCGSRAGVGLLALSLLGWRRRGTASR